MFTHHPLLAAMIFVVMAGSALAGNDLAPPKGDVVLTITGLIDRTNHPGGALFDLQMLQTLGTQQIETATIWTEGQQSFSGVRLSTLLDAVGAHGSVLQATAMNDYSVEIPATDASADGPIIAYLHNGVTMTVRDKGPLWIVYPYDSKREYAQDLIYTRSIWQLTHIEVRD
ncbi:molybdopterin-dependent oxidoreductase [Yoonia sp. 67]|uniref:molybdopterin-dependent oxidoreductase n=1 Tax=Yoonia sp. 67 TaxID=3081449 RepID=UPI002AFFBD4A|nr:molybdopterin-dependent oxidoreductase [Yoonia sp. 67]